MSAYLRMVSFSAIFSITSMAFAAFQTERTPQFSNNKIAVWETVIYPGHHQELKMHRHDHDRVLVAFTDGTLKVTNDKGKVSYLKLAKNKPYYLAKDIPHEKHKDENLSLHPIKVLIMEFRGQA